MVNNNETEIKELPYLFGLKLEYMKNTSNSHFEKDGSIAAAKLHYVPKFRWMQVFLWNRPEEVNLKCNEIGNVSKCVVQNTINACALQKNCCDKTDPTLVDA